MNEVVRYETREGVALITVANPPVNALVQPVRAGIDASLARAIADQDVGAIVIGAEGRTFPVGTDVREFHREADRPRLGEVCARIEASPKPVIAAVHGTALGGGLELALACHYRLALAGAQFGLPDVMLGVVPTAGGTQRLPRLIGAARALEMLLSGRPVKAKHAERAGLIDKMIRKNLERAAFGTARNMAREGQPPRPTAGWTGGFSDPAGYLAVVAARRSALAEEARAEAEVVRLVEAALLVPFETGLAMERAAYEDLVHSPAARGLRHAFLAERRAARAGAAQGGAPREIRQVAVLGQGPTAARVARAVLAGGLPVLLAEPDGPARLALRARIVADYAGEVQAGRFEARRRDRELEGLQTTGDLADLGDAALVIAAAEDPDALRADLARAGAEAPPDTLIASGAGFVSPGDLERIAQRPGAVLGLAMPAPANRTRLVELALPETAPGALAAAGIALARRCGKVPVVLASGAAGRLTGALEGAMFAAAEVLALTGTDPGTIDAALRGAGLPEGPFEKADRGWLAPVDAPGGDSRLLARMRSAGWTGRAAGQGFYRYGTDGARLGTAPEALRLIGALREASRVPAAVTPPGPEEIRRRVLLAMANAGARLVRTGVAAQPSDVDVAALHGLGLARRLGGPMLAADETGLLHARNLMHGWGGSGDLSMAVWSADPLFEELIHSNRTFDDLNA